MKTLRIQKKENITTRKLLGKKQKAFFHPAVIQKKLSIGSPNDAYEMEADNVADKVVSISNNQVQTTSKKGSLVQRKCASCEKEELQKKPLAKSITPLIQRASNGSESSVASDNVTSKINKSKGSGNMMDNNTQSSMENSFGADFSDVRIHTGSNAIQLSKQLNAQAFTVGNDVYFNEGKYNPTSNSGKHLLAHELTHTLQQGGVQRKIQRRIHSGGDNNGNYVFNDKACTFNYRQHWFFQFKVPISNSEKNRLMNLAVVQVHDTWSEKFKLLPTALAGFINCPCGTEGVSVNVDINTSEGKKEGKGIQVTVMPSVRAFVNPVLNTMSLQLRDFIGYTHLNSTGHQFTVAHEFGHTIDITDEYNGWAELLAPSVNADGSAIMNIGGQVRPRHYQYFADMLSLEMLGCRYSPNGIRQPERENPVLRSMSLSGITGFQDGLSLTPPNTDTEFGTNYELRTSNNRLFGLFYPQIGGIRLWNPTTGRQSDYGITGGLRLGQIAHPLVFNLRTGVVMNPKNPSSGIRLPINLQVGLRNENFEFGVHYTPIINLINGNTTHLFGAGLQF